MGRTPDLRIAEQLQSHALPLNTVVSLGGSKGRNSQERSEVSYLSHHSATTLDSPQYNIFIAILLDGQFRHH